MISDGSLPVVRFATYLGLCVTIGVHAVFGGEDPVRMAEEKVVIPTYEIGPADPNPMFYTNESYQGAQKRIYPYALQDHLTHAKVDKQYTALVLENDYVGLSVLPEIGGRLFSAVDKANGYDFFYRQHVIKPALIGMLGAWISGGVEWVRLSPSPQHDLHADRLHAGRESGREQDDLVRRD